MSIFKIWNLQPFEQAPPTHSKQPFTRATALVLSIAIVFSMTLSGCDWFKQQEEIPDSTTEMEPEPPDPMDEPEPSEDAGVEAPSEGEEPVVSTEEPDNTEPGEPSPTSTTPNAASEQTPSTGSTTAGETPSTPPATPAILDLEETPDVVTTPVAEQPQTATQLPAPTPVATSAVAQNSTPLAARSQSVPLAAPTNDTATQLLSVASAIRPKALANTKYKNVLFRKKGSYSESKIYKNGTIESGDTVISNKTFTGDVTITASAGSDPVTLKNCDIQGTLTIKGSGWVKLYDTEVDYLVAENTSRTKVFGSGKTEVSAVRVKNDTTIEEGTITTGYDGFKNIDVNGTKGLELYLKGMPLNKLTTTTNANVIYDSNTIVNYLYTKAPTKLYGNGDVYHLIVSSNGVYYETKPLDIQVKKGYATPSRHGDSSSNTPTKDTVQLYGISDKYISKGENRYVSVDTNGTSISVTNSDRSVCGVFVDGFQLRVYGRGAGTSTVRITSSRNGYKSATTSFRVIVEGTNTDDVWISSINNYSMDAGDTRYVSVNTNGTSLQTSNSNSSVAAVYIEGTHLRIKAKNKGYTDVTVYAYRNGYRSSSETFRVTVTSSNDSSKPTVQISSINDQILNPGNQQIINVDTNGDSITVSNSNPKVAKVTKNGLTLQVDALKKGITTVKVTSTRRNYNSNTISFDIYTTGNVPSAPTVSITTGESSYTPGTWTDQDVSFSLGGYSSERTLYVRERNPGSSSWSARKSTSSPYKVSAEGTKEYYFFTDGSAGMSTGTRIFKVMIDKTKPVLTNKNVSGASLTFKASDALSQVKTVTIQGENQNKVILSPNSSGIYSYTAPQTGTYTTTVIDNAGNIATEKFTLTTTSNDKTPPVIAVTSPTEKDKWFNSEVTVRFTVKDDGGSGVDENFILINGIQNYAKETDGSYYFVASANGENKYTISAMDNQKNKAVAQSFSIKIDRDKPTFGPITTDANKKTIQFTVSDTGGSGIAEVRSSSNNSILTPVDNTYSFQAEPNVSYTITAKDGAGNEISQTVKMDDSVTPTPPADSKITISTPVVSPDVNTPAKSYTVSFNVTATLPEGDAVEVYVTSNSNSRAAAPALTTSSSSYSFTVTENAVYTIHAKSKTITTEQVASVTINKIDTTNPTITVDQLQAQNKAITPTVKFTVADSQSNVTVKVMEKGTSTILAVTPGTNAGEYSFTGANGKTYSIVATDEASNSTSQDVTIQVPQNAISVEPSSPILTITSSPALSADKKSVSGTFRADSPDSPLASASVDNSANAKATISGDTIQFAATENGSYTLTVTNKAGKSATTKIDVTGIVKDAAAPTLSVASAPTLSGDKKSVSASIKAVSPDSPLASASVDNSANAKATISGDTIQFTATENGSYTLTVTNKAGKTATTKIDVTGIVKDAAAPTLSVASAPTLSGDKKSVSASIKAVSPDSPLASASVDNSANAKATISGDTIQFTASENGSYTLTVTNKAGKSATTKIDATGIVKEAAAPTLALASAPQVTSSKESATATLKITAPDTPIESVSVDKTDKAQVTQSGESIQFTATENGSYTVTVKDKAGKTASAQVNVTGISQDTTAPVIQLPTPSIASTDHRNASTEFTVVDEHLKSVTSTSGEVSGSAGKYTFKATANGSYTITATDENGNSSQATLTVTGIDWNIKPTISHTGTTPSAGGAVLSFKVSNNGGSAIVSIKDGNGTALNGSGENWNLTVTQNGTYTITVSNEAGQNETVSVKVDNIDAAPPQISTPSVALNDAKTAATITFSVTDDTKVASVTINGNPATGSGNNYSATITANGNYSIAATDVAGNQSTATAAVTGIDTDPPIIDTFSMPNGWQKWKTITVTASDDVGLADPLTVTLNGTPITVSGSNGSYSFLATAPGKYIATIKDLAGHTTTTDINITQIDAVAPPAPVLYKSLDSKNTPKDALKAVTAKSAATNAASTNSVIFTFTAAKDATESQVDGYYKIGSGKYKKIKNNASIPLKAGENTIVVKAMDLAGNSSAEVTYKVTYTPKSTEKPSDTDTSKNTTPEQNTTSAPKTPDTANPPEDNGSSAEATEAPEAPETSEDQEA